MNIDKTTVISPAVLQPNPVGPNKKLNIAIGVVIGLLIGAAIAFILEFRDKSLKNPTYITDELELVFLGDISHISDREKTDSATFFNNLTAEKSVEKKETTNENDAPARSRERV
jgi:uncharacterized protein YacL